MQSTSAMEGRSEFSAPQAEKTLLIGAV